MQILAGDACTAAVTSDGILYDFSAKKTSLGGAGYACTQLSHVTEAPDRSLSRQFWPGSNQAETHLAAVIDGFACNCIYSITKQKVEGWGGIIA